MVPIVSMGLDVSTKTGCIVLRQSYGRPELLFEGMFLAGKNVTGLARCSEIAGQVVDQLEKHRPTIVVFEGYAYNAKSPFTLIVLVEINTVARYFVRQHGHAMAVVPPEMLKKFVAGKGNIKKSLLPMHVMKRWGYEAATDDLADAYGLAAVGLAYHGVLDGMIKPQLDVISRLKQTSLI